MSDFDTSPGSAAEPSPATGLTESLATVASAMFTLVHPLVPGSATENTVALPQPDLAPASPTPAPAAPIASPEPVEDARPVAEPLPPVPPTAPRPSVKVSQALLQEISFLDE